MAQMEEKMRVLQMIEAGKVTPEEGARLMDAIEEKRAVPAAVGREGSRCLVVRVFEGGEKPKVNVTVPIALGRLALKFIPRSAMEQLEDEGLSVDDIDELVRSIEQVGPMRFVEIQDGDTRVEVGIE